jgi:hypothetical protein
MSGIVRAVLANRCVRPALVVVLRLDGSFRASLICGGRSFRSVNKLLQSKATLANGALRDRTEVPLR